MPTTTRCGRDSHEPALCELLAMAMRRAREIDGHGFGQIDRAIAMAIVLEAMQRAALVTNTPGGQVPAHDAVAAIFDAVFGDIHDEALRILRQRLH